MVRQQNKEMAEQDSVNGHSQIPSTDSMSQANNQLTPSPVQHNDSITLIYDFLFIFTIWNSL